jgi:hypothetical protein
MRSYSAADRSARRAPQQWRMVKDDQSRFCRMKKRPGWMVSSIAVHSKSSYAFDRPAGKNGARVSLRCIRVTARIQSGTRRDRAVW